MRINRILRGLSAASFLAIGACSNSLEISNPNDPDAKRALSDPATIEAVAGGTMHTWFNAWTPLRVAATMSAQARSYSASWNNGNMNFYSSVYDASGARIGATDTVTSPATWTRNGAAWQNDPSAAARTSVDAFWTGGLDEGGTSRPGFYGALSAANDALTAIRKNGVSIGTTAATKRAETVAQLMQGFALASIAMNYDKGYVVDENTDLTTLSYSDRKAVRDAAVAKLNAAYALAIANTFTTPAAWSGGGSVTYTNTQLAQVAKTMVAMTLAYYARDAVEAAATDWAAVEAAAALGMSSGTPFDFVFVGDGCVAWCHEAGEWMNSLDTGRIWTRVAHFMDPATQKDPYPHGIGNTQPNSPDKRLGDGSFGTASMVGGFGNIPKTANGGTDFAFSTQGAIFRPDRGFFHQSNIGHIRFDLSGVQSTTGIYFGYGQAPAISAATNDLLWAEALIRQGGAGKLAQAATLINKTRVTRGNLSSAALLVGTVGAPTDGPCMTNAKLAKDGTACTLWSVLLYENEIELLGLGPISYYNQRHLPNVSSTGWERPAGYTGIYNGPRFIQGLLPGTPRDMPVPYKELGIKGDALYTYGGSVNPDKSPTPP